MTGSFEVGAFVVIEVQGPIEIEVGISAVSIEQAKVNLVGQVGKDFNSTLRMTLVQHSPNQHLSSRPLTSLHLSLSYIDQILTVE